MEWSMESNWTVPWNPCGMVHGIHGILMEQYMDLQFKFIGNSMDSTWTVHGIHMEWCIPWTFHMESIVDMEWKHEWGPSQKVVHGTVHGMGAFHPIPYGFHMESTGECKDLLKF